MKTKAYLLILAAIFYGGLSIGWAQNELVRGYYDPVNDWFVFEWDRPDYGRVRGIYDPPNKIKPVIKAEVGFDRTAQEYTYNYEVTNEEGAVQILDDIFVKHPAPIYDAKAPFPEDDWFMGEYRDYNEWEWAKWGGIPAGQTEKGFSFKSGGLPAIVDSYLFGEQRAETSFPGDEDTEEVNEAFDRIYNDFKEKYKEKHEKITKKTLGPTAPPADFKPLEFLDYIISMKHEAFTLGWIRNAGIENSLDKKLDSARKSLERGSATSAKNVLSALVNEVEAQGCAIYDDCPSGKHLTPEAWALLKYNVEYLLDRL